MHCLDKMEDTSLLQQVVRIATTVIGEVNREQWTTLHTVQGKETFCCLITSTNWQAKPVAAGYLVEGKLLLK